MLPVLPTVIYLKVGLEGIGVDSYVEELWGLEINRFQSLYVGLPDECSMLASLYQIGPTEAVPFELALVPPPPRQTTLSLLRRWARPAA
jgi:hypothetical protein